MVKQEMARVNVDILEISELKWTGMGSFSLLQGIFPTQESNPGFLYCRWILYKLKHREAQEY